MEKFETIVVNKTTIKEKEGIDEALNYLLNGHQ